MLVYAVGRIIVKQKPDRSLYVQTQVAGVTCRRKNIDDLYTELFDCRLFNSRRLTAALYTPNDLAPLKSTGEVISFVICLTWELT